MFGYVLWGFRSTCALHIAPRETPTCYPDHEDSVTFGTAITGLKQGGLRQLCREASWACLGCDIRARSHCQYLPQAGPLCNLAIRKGCVESRSSTSVEGRRWRFATVLLGSMAILRVQEVCRSTRAASSKQPLPCQCLPHLLQKSSNADE